MVKNRLVLYMFSTKEIPNNEKQNCHFDGVLACFAERGFSKCNLHKIDYYQAVHGYEQGRRKSLF